MDTVEMAFASYSNLTWTAEPTLVAIDLREPMQC